MIGTSRFSARSKRTGVLLLAILLLFLFGFPFIFVLITSFKSQMGYMKDLWGFPREIFLGNYTKVLSLTFLTYFLNSLLISSLSVGIGILVASLASYAFARVRFRLSKPLFMIFLIGMMIPAHTTLIPIYQLINRIGLYNSKFALLGPYISFTMPISVFIITQFFREVPEEILDAATIDGSGPLRTFWNIMMPLSTPAIATVGIYNFLQTWNEFIFALVLVTKTSEKTLPLGIRDFYGVESVNIPAVLTAVLVGSLPVMLFYFFAQEQVINGLSAGAVKE